MSEVKKRLLSCFCRRLFHGIGKCDRSSNECLIYAVIVCLYVRLINLAKVVPRFIIEPEIFIRAVEYFKGGSAIQPSVM